MADFGMGSLATGRVEAWENWNNADQVSIHYKLSCEIRGGAYNYGPGPSWNGTLGGGHVGSGTWTYSSNGWRTLREFDVTFNKDANGYISIGVYGYINGDNSPYVSAGSASFTLNPGRSGYPPPIVGLSADTIKTTTARLGAEIGGYGKGTSAAFNMYYRESGVGGWTHAGTQSDVGGYNYWNISGLKPGKTYEYYVQAYNNNGDSGNSGVQSFKTLPVSGMIAVIKGLI